MADKMKGKLPTPRNDVAKTFAETRGGAGAGVHHNRERDVEKGRSRKEKHKTIIEAGKKIAEILGVPVTARFETGVTVDVPKYLEEHGNPEAAAAWTDMNEEYGDQFKTAEKQDDEKQDALTEKQAQTEKRASVGSIIIKQLGGERRLILMIGCFYIKDIPNGVEFAWPIKSGVPANHCKVILNGGDLYDVTFYRSKPVRIGQTVVEMSAPKVVKHYDDIYAENLIDLFEDTTKLYLKLAKRAALDDAALGQVYALVSANGELLAATDDQNLSRNKAYWLKRTKNADLTGAKIKTLEGLPETVAAQLVDFGTPAGPKIPGDVLWQKVKLYAKL